MDSNTKDAGGKGRRVLAILTLTGATALTTIVTWAITLASDSATDHLRASIDIKVQSDPTQTAVFSGEQQEIVLPRRGLIAEDPGPGCRKLYTFGRALGGVDAGETRAQILLSRNSPGTVVVSQAYLVIDERLPSLTGSHLFCGPEGELENRDLVVDLDSTQPRIKYVSNNGKPFGFSLKEGDVESFTIRARTNKALVHWHLEFIVVEGTETKSVRVDQDGRPFSTSAVSSNTWSWDGSAWNGHDGAGQSVSAVPGQQLIDD